MRIIHFIICCSVSFGLHLFTQDITETYLQNIQKLEQGLESYKKRLNPQLHAYQQIDIHNTHNAENITSMLNLYQDIIANKKILEKTCNNIYTIMETCRTQKDELYTHHASPIIQNNPDVLNACIQLLNSINYASYNKRNVSKVVYDDILVFKKITSEYEDARKKYGHSAAPHTVAHSLVSDMHANIATTPYVEHNHDTSREETKRHKLYARRREATTGDTEPFGYCGWFAHEDIIYKVLLNSHFCFQDICNKHLHQMCAYRDLLQKLKQITHRKNRSDTQQDDMNTYIESAHDLYAKYCNASDKLEQKINTYEHIHNDVLSTNMTSTYYVPIDHVCYGHTISERTRGKIDAAISSSNASIHALDRAHKLSHIIQGAIAPSDIYNLTQYFYLFHRHQHCKNTLRNIFKQQRDMLNELITKMNTTK